MIQLIMMIMSPALPGGISNDLPTKILDFRGFDSSRILIVRGGILMSIGNFPESLTQAILVGRFLVGRLGVSNTRVSEVRERGQKEQKPLRIWVALLV